MQTISALTAAGDTDPGLQRQVNEDRFHVDVARGLFVLVDGVGGQAAGGKAADVALTMLRISDRSSSRTALRLSCRPPLDCGRWASTQFNSWRHSRS